MSQSALPDRVEPHGLPEGRLIPKRWRNLRISLKEWQILHAIVEYGSYANAARMLHRTQPAISYTIAKLEERLSVPLLIVEGRKAQLTEHGMELLSRSRILLEHASELEQFAESLRHTISPETQKQ